jgi:adenylate cyclase
MQRAMPSVNRANAAKGIPEVEMGIGLHTGEVVVGNIGSVHRAKYGVVGRAVNFVSRIESYSVGGQVLVSPAFREALGELAELGAELKVHTKGMSEVSIHALTGLGGDFGIRLERRDAVQRRLEWEVPLRFTIVEGKDARGIERAGAFVALSSNRLEAEVDAEEGVQPLTNLRVRLGSPEHEVYCKVLAREPMAGRFVVRFTSLPEAARALLVAALGV